MPKYDVQGLLEMADTAVSAFNHLRETYAQIKDTLSTKDQTLLNDKLRSIHSANMTLSGELDAALAAAEGDDGA